MEFLSDRQCCVRCLRKGLRVPLIPKPYSPKKRWCRSCWQEIYRREDKQRTRYKQQQLRVAEWKARAMMTKEERRKTPLVYISWRVVYPYSKRIGKPRPARHYLRMYAKYRKQIMLQSSSPSDPPPPRSGPPLAPPVFKSRHKILPIA